MGLAVLSVAGPGRAWADDPLASGTRLGRPGHLVHSSDGTRVYRANGAPGITVLERGLRVLREIVTDEPVDLLALSQDGRWLYRISPRAAYLVQWPTLPTLLVPSLLIVSYVRLAWREEHEMEARFGEAYREYRRRVPGFVPALPLPVRQRGLDAREMATSGK